MSKEQYLSEQGEQLFSKRSSLLWHWQDIALHFYPERANFTNDRTLGEEFATNLASGYPLLVRRELGDTFGGMLRPTNKNWFYINREKEEDTSPEAKRWLERAEKIQRRRMYHKKTNFVNAMKQGDHDYAAFGQYVNQVSLDRNALGLLYRNWHLKDCAWIDDDAYQMETMYRKWKPTYLEVVRHFRGNASAKVREKVDGTPYETIEAYHIIMPTDVSEHFNKWNTPFVGIFFDLTNNHIMEEVGLLRQEYYVPRWARLSHTQYAYSPATVIGLADARTLQEMTITLLEAGEKATTPPMVGVKGALRSDVNLMAGGLTWVDKAYDQRLGEVLRPITIDKSGIPTGFEMAADYREQLFKAFYLNKLAMPPNESPEMTAFEVGQRIEEYIRNALPLFEPMELEANSPVCEMTFEILLAQGAFGSPFDMPQDLQGAGIEFKFESPLHDAIERQKGQQFSEAQQVIAAAAAVDPNASMILDVGEATRDTLEGIGVPAKWIRDKGTVDKIAAQAEQEQKEAAMMDKLQQGAEVAKTISETEGVGGLGGQPPGGL